MKEGHLTNKLQYRFIAITSFAVTIVMMVLLLMLNLYNYGETYREAYRVLRFIADSGGEIHENGLPPEENETKLPGFDNSNDLADSHDNPVNITNIWHNIASVFIREHTPDLSGEASYRIRYYSVLFDQDDNIVEVNARHIASIDGSKISSTARSIIDRHSNKGHFIDDALIYTYLVQKTPDHGKLVVVMDSTNEVSDATDIIRRSFLFGVLCLVIFVIIMIFLSKQAILPIIRNMENQKSFITNAGHELKTPLAVIRADTELIEMTGGQTEWTKSITNQVDRLTVLVGNLITLSKMGEIDEEELTDVDLSGCVRQSVDDYRAIIENQGQSLSTDIAESIVVRGTKDALTETVNILLDNAQKYCDEGGHIDVTLSRSKKSSGAKLLVSNDYKDGKDTDYTKFFDRFYRGDTSHNSTVSGYGIGLSMAEGFVKEFGGRIYASWEDGRITFTVIL